MKVTVFAACALLMCLMATPVLAATISSTAYVDLGTKDWVKAGSQSLNTNDLSGFVTGTDETYMIGEPGMSGEMWTRGVINSVRRDYAGIPPYGYATLSWSNDDHETGTFYARARSPQGNNAGYCRVSQTGH